MKIINVVGARPNFMKVAPIHRLMVQSEKIEPVLVHTGQHYDEKMSEIFFEQLGLPKPDVYLGVGSDSHAKQTAKIMVEFEQVCLEHKPDIVLVVGDVNSTVACSLVAAKLGIKVCHVEAGLRSFDKRMPEEINRMVTDAISDYLFVSEISGLVHLREEGVDENKIFFVGNVMIDSLVHNLKKAEDSAMGEILDIKDDGYCLTTLHRPSNVDNKEKAQILVDTLTEMSEKMDIVFPIHPRTEKTFKNFDLYDQLFANPKIKLTEPASYFDFIYLMAHAKMIMTDSGGIQEETTYLKKPCLTLRENTERPITITEGTNILIKETDKDIIMENVNNILAGNTKKGKVPELWDGKTAERIVDILENLDI